MDNGQKRKIPRLTPLGRVLLVRDILTTTEPDKPSGFGAARGNFRGIRMGGLVLKPTTLKKANDFVQSHHRHNGRTSRDGGKWAVSVTLDDEVVGVAIVGNPLSATLMDGWTAEVLRVCTPDESTRNACSMLYAACWRAWKAMGGRKLATYTLRTESGASLRAAGFVNVAAVRGRGKGWGKTDHLNDSRTHSAVVELDKYRWEIKR